MCAADALQYYRSVYVVLFFRTTFAQLWTDSLISLHSYMSSSYFCFAVSAAKKSHHCSGHFQGELWLAS